jgi:hypothetical protein
MVIGGASDKYFNSEIHELIIVKNLDHNQKEIENNQIKRLHKLD